MRFDLEKARDAAKMYNSRNPNVNTAVWAHNCAEHLQGAIDLIEQQADKIRELEEEIERRAKPNASDDWGNPIVLSVSDGVYDPTVAKGKIGPDAETAHHECQECDDEFCDEDECHRDILKESNFDNNVIEVMTSLKTEVIQLHDIIDTTSEEPKWAEDFEKLDRYTRLGYSLIDIEIAKKWHAAYRKAQNSNILRKQENEQLRASIVEHEEHENQTHEVLGNILGTDDTLENVAKRAAVQIKELNDALKSEKSWVSQYKKWLIEEVAEGMSENGFANDDLRQKARDSLILDGKIGPDADAKSRVWKITKDRVDALKGEINGYDIYDNDIETHSLKMRRKNVLKTMLKEATD